MATRKTGMVHKKSKLQPVHQRDAQEPVDPSVPQKPNFDEKDQNISPKRKAPGPVKRRRRSSAARSNNETTNRPEANIKDDHHSK